MSWRTVIVTSHCKLAYKNNYMVVRGDELHMVHLSEMSTLMIDSGQVSMSAALMTELIKNKVNIILCDEKHNPLAEMNTYYGAYNTSKKIRNQVEWDDEYKKWVWTKLLNKRFGIKQSFCEGQVLQKA